MEELKFETGLVEFSVNGSRTIRFNPSDPGFLETLYGLVAKIDAIEADMAKKKDKSNDPAKFFDIVRSSDKRMRDAVDSVFGDGFCADVFNGIHVTALAGGLTVLENLVFAIMDRMDDSVKENMAQRNDKIAKYTAKYQKYLQK